MPSSAPSPAWPSACPNLEGATISGPGATACTASRCAITPAQLRAVAAQLYRELLRGGYTQVCEFHYLQHRPDGRPYADPLALVLGAGRRAADAGIGLTLLPVLYERAGFTQPALRDDQRRFATDADAVIALARGVARAARPPREGGVAIHSLRAAAPASIHAPARSGR
jgi:formimidoylglutamate deiminase